MYSEILVPLDGSERAEKILAHVEELARLCDAEVILLQVMECPPVVSGIVGAPFDEEQCLKEVRRRREDVESYLEAWQGKLREKGVKARILLGQGPVVEAILGAAESEGADLIAIASHGRTGLPRVFYGSVAAGVLHRADRPLLVIRSQGHIRGERISTRCGSDLLSCQEAHQAGEKAESVTLSDNL